MIIELLGASGAKIQSGDAIILLAPPSTQSDLRAARFKADVVVLGKADDEVNVEPRAEKLFTINAPGEYEVGGLFVYCLAGPRAGQTASLLAMVTVEGVTVAHLGSLAQPLSSSELELFEGADVLLVPVGGKDVLDSGAAKDLVEQIEPRVVIPMHFAQKELKTPYDDVSKFFKEMGASPEPQERAKILKKDLPLDTVNVLYVQP